MDRAELFKWAADPRRRTDEVAVAVRDLFRDFTALCDMDGVPGYLTVQKDNEMLRSQVDQLLAENARLRAAGLPKAPWET